MRCIVRGGVQAMATYMTDLTAGVTAARTTELTAFKACLTSGRSTNGVLQTEQSPKQCTHVVGNRHFFDSDYHVHRQPGWMVSVRMYSIRYVHGTCGTKACALETVHDAYNLLLNLSL